MQQAQWKTLEQFLLPTKWFQISENLFDDNWSRQALLHVVMSVFSLYVSTAFAAAFEFYNQK